MLKFYKASNPEDILLYLQKFNPEKQTWIVSDLKSKQEIQNECLRRFGYYADDSIMRLSDFWRLWLRRLSPQIQVVSGDFIKILVQKFIEKYHEALELKESDASTLADYLNEFASIILHSDSQEALDEWMVQQDFKKWFEWYKLARTCLKYIIQEHQVIDAKWAAAYLQSINLTAFQWSQEIIFDLGTEVNSIEMGLIKKLSEKQPVTVIIPSPVWQNKFPFLYKTYQQNMGYGAIENERSEPSDSQNFFPKTKKFIRLSTQLAEVKFAVSQIRNWCDNGIPKKQIAVISSQIEVYWPTLETYLELEGIKINKNKVVSLNSLSSTQMFLAYLKSLTSEVDFESLQQKFFQKNAKAQFKFEKFKALFSQIYSDDDLQRDEKVKQLFYKKINFHDEINRDDFLSLVAKLWTDRYSLENEEQVFEIIFKDLLSQSSNINLKISKWCQFVKARLSRKELTVVAAEEEGIKVLNLMSAQLSEATHKIYIGLYEEAFKSNSKINIPLSDIESLKNSFDLAIDYPEESYLDFNLRWQMEGCFVESILTTPHLGFAAEPLTTAIFYLQNDPQSEIVIPPPIRSDELQKKLSYDFEASQNLQNQPFDFPNERLKDDLKGQDLVLNGFEYFQILSASDVEAYSHCHFKLLAAKGFKLKDLPEVSVDLDPRQKGTLAHALFEFCIQSFSKNNFSFDMVADFLDSKRSDFNLYPNDDVFWKIQKNRFLTLAKKFIENEKERARFFSTQTEVAFELHYDFNANKFVDVKIASDTNLTIKGRIDRIDQHREKKYFIIYDYKSSERNLEPVKKWLSERQLQMLFYFIAFQKCIDSKSEVKGALYYLYKTFALKKGFIDKSTGVEALNISTRSSLFLEKEDQQNLVNEFENLMLEILNNLKLGLFSAKPFKTEICESCDWIKICRAKHLV